MSKLKLSIDKLLMDTVIDGTVDALAMAGIVPVPVGVTRVSTASQELSCIIGLGGRSSGTVSMNASRHAACHIIGQLLGDTFDDLNDDVLDGFMELGNIIGGFVKSKLEGTNYHVESLTLPSILFGGHRGVYHGSNITTCSVMFELPKLPPKYMTDRYFTTAVSLLRSAGR